DRQRANRAVEELKRGGFRDDQIGVAGRHDEAEAETGTRTEEGAVTGFLAGAGLGGLVGLGIVAGLIPAVGPALPGGTRAAVLAGAAGGAGVGGRAGALARAGTPEDEARYYESEFYAGRVLVTVTTDGRDDEAIAALRRHGAYDLHTEGVSAAEGASRA